RRQKPTKKDLSGVALPPPNLRRRRRGIRPDDFATPDGSEPPPWYNARAMPEPLVYLLLAMALLLPIIGAVALRLSGPHVSTRIGTIAAAILFGVTIASVLLLSRSDVGVLRIGDVSLLLPGTRPGASFALPADIPLSDAPPDIPAAAPVALPTLTPRPSATATATSTPLPTATPTALPTATPAPPTATPAPPTTTRHYTVESGDSLRSIAAKFDVSITALLKANNLTPAQGDALHIGQELVIP
ncbi:MAG: LysM peptidoglycan-binding domain-containing protein, partial [Chloroflexales bacterium]